MPTPRKCGVLDLIPGPSCFEDGFLDAEALLDVDTYKVGDEGAPVKVLKILDNALIHGLDKRGNIWREIGYKNVTRNEFRNRRMRPTVVQN